MRRASRAQGDDGEAMKTWKKTAIVAGVVILLLAIVGFTVHQSHKNVVTVQTGKAQRLDLASVVSASGEIKPKTYVNIGANAFGKITKLYVKEGDRVKKDNCGATGNVQSAADVSATQASLDCGGNRRRRGRRRHENCYGRPESCECGRRTYQAGLGSRSSLYQEALIAKSDTTTAKTHGRRHKPGWRRHRHDWRR